MPAHSRPTSAMSRPIPTEMACLSDAGIAVMTRSRRPMPAVRMNSDAGKRDGAERDRPRRAARHDHGEREKEVVPHRRRDGDGIVGGERHDERGDRRRQARRRQDGARIHAGGRQHGGLNEDDVRHRQERRRARDDLGADGGSGRGKVKEPIQHGGRRILDRIDLCSANLSAMPDVTRALAQIEAIHDQLAKGEIYRGWRSLPVAASGIVGLAAARGSRGEPAGRAVELCRLLDGRRAASRSSSDARRSSGTTRATRRAQNGVSRGVF